MIVMLMALSVALSITLEQIFSKISVNYISIVMGMIIEGGYYLYNEILQIEALIVDDYIEE